MKILITASALLLLLSGNIKGQEEKKSIAELSGFTRVGLHTGFDPAMDNKPYVSGVYSDVGLKLDAANGVNCSALCDLRFRYGSEFREAVNQVRIREAYITIYGKKWSLKTGQQIIKWGKSDFTNPISKLNPQNFVSRSTDREDMDLGNLDASLSWSPAELISIEAVIVPVYRPSVLITSPVKLPSFVTLGQNSSIITGRNLHSLGLRSELHFRGVDLGLCWFSGYDPMPGIALRKFNLDLSSPLPVFSMALSTMPYKINMAGADYAITAGNIGIRGEAAFSWPSLNPIENEYIPFPELRWVGGIDWNSGSYRFIIEYSGKWVADFSETAARQLIGTEPDLTELATLFQTPGFDPGSYLKGQVAAFNRLYNYQLKKFCHSAGLRIDGDLSYGRINPSLSCMYNFSARDLVAIPELILKPADGLRLTLGGEFYHGMSGSLFDIIDDFMNCVYVGVRMDF